MDFNELLAQFKGKARVGQYNSNGDPAHWEVGDQPLDLVKHLPGCRVHSTRSKGRVQFTVDVGERDATVSGTVRVDDRDGTEWLTDVSIVRHHELRGQA